MMTRLTGGHPAYAGIALMIGAILFLSVMDALIKWLTAFYPTEQIVFFRFLFGFCLVVGVLLARNNLIALRTNRIFGHMLRGATGLGAMMLFSFGLAKLPLAENVALTFIAPLLVTIFSIPLLGEYVGWRRWVAVIVGFIGILVIVRPGFEVFSPYAIFPLGAAVSFSLMIIQTRRLTSTEATSTIVFYGAGFSTLGSLLPALNVWQTPETLDLLFLATTGVLGTIGTFMMTQAFQHAPPAIVTPFEYTAMIWALIFGYLVWGEVPDALSLLGSAIVIGSGIYIVHREAIRARENEQQP